MKIETQNYDNITVVKLQGEFTDESAKPFQDTGCKLIADGTDNIVLDMSSIVFIDSLGLEQLIWFRDYCQENSRQLKLAGLDESCSKIMEITRIGPQFDIYTELSEAVKSFV